MKRELARALARQQLSDGSFPNNSAPREQEPGPGARTHSTTFFPALIALALSGVRPREAPEVATVCDRAVGFLLAEAKPTWTFNYWARASPEARSLLYPDDWDDTSLALAAISLHRPEALSGGTLAKIVTLLTNTEEREGGPYRTWVMPADSAPQWLDVDLAVNANIAFFLKLQGVELPSMDQLVEERLLSGRLESKYYPKVLPVLYFVSRFYRGRERDRLGEMAVRELQAGVRAENALDAALALTAGVNFGAARPRLIAGAKWLGERSPADILRPYAFCLDPVFEGKQHVAGAAAFTAAAVLEAMELLEGWGEEKPGQLVGLADELHAAIMAEATARFDRAGEEVRQRWPALLDRILLNDGKRQSTLMPWLFCQALGQRGEAIGRAMLVEFGAASLYGWAAYTIYDDFLDNEGEAAMLPLANLALRELTTIYMRRPSTAELLGRVLDQMEDANAWEVYNTRIKKQSDLLGVKPPDYGNLARLADRSMGHALGCFAIMSELGFNYESPEVRSLERFFRHYIIARQLGDEAHDWKLDLKRGQINAVASMLLADTIPRGNRVKTFYDRMERQFWTYLIPRVCNLIDNHLGQAREALGECHYLERPEALAQVLDPVERMSAKTRREQKRTLEFLDEYGVGKSAKSE